MNSFRISPVRKAEIILLYEQNVPLCEIAERFKLSLEAVRLWVYRYSSVMYSHHKTSLNQSRLLDKTKELNKGVKNIRVQFAKKYLDFDWCNNIVIFSTEKCLQINNERGLLVWEKADQSNHDSIKIPRKSKDTNILCLRYILWMSSVGSGELIKVDKDIFVKSSEGRKSYIGILENVMLPSVRAVHPDAHIYLVHSSNSRQRLAWVNQWFHKQTSLTIIDWPPKSADICPMEKLWALMVKKWDLNRVETALHNEVAKSWKSFHGSRVCVNMFANMKTKLQKIIDTNGEIVL